MTRSLLCSLLLVPLLAAPSRADDDPREAAAAHYARGMELVNQGLYQAALEQFNDAYTASPHFAVLYNIGEAQMALGRPLEAIEALTKYLRDGADQVPLSRREQVQAQIGLLESRLAELTVSANRQGAEIRVDGRDVGRTPLFQPIRLAAGAHTVTAALASGEQITRDVPLKESERRTLELTFSSPLRAPPGGVQDEATPPEGALQLSAASAPPVQPWYYRGQTMRRMAYVCAGLGVVSGGLALGIYLSKRGQYSEWQAGDAALSNDTMGSVAYMRQAEANNGLASSLSSANAQIIGLSIAGGALVAAGVSLFFLDRAHRREASQVSLGLGERSANVGWTWSW
ncbi:MAG TPA: tetratricopeptide repeat protein [Polyangia bacterium]|nr:tetratricopeptide repeat protein [Polyangia bacterium]